MTIEDAQFSDGNSFWTGVRNSQIAAVLGNTAADDNLESAVQGLIFSSGNMVGEIPVTTGVQQAPITVPLFQRRAWYGIGH